MKTAFTTLLLACAALPAFAQTVPATRGALLYETHCGACHTEKMHWRNNKAATDWGSLKGQVARWQQTGQLNWSAEEIDDVARYLNDRFYRFRPPAPAA